jgi:microfibrillar-associated protein 1
VAGCQLATGGFRVYRFSVVTGSLKACNLHCECHKNKLKMASNFTARDLALALPDKAGDIISLRHTGGGEADLEKYEPLKPKIDPSKKVIRYFPGQAPKWTNDGDSSSAAASETKTASKGGNSGVVDRRLARLAAASGTKQVDADAPKSRRRVYEAEIVVEEDEEDDSGPRNEDDYIENFMDNDDEEDEDDVVARRNRVRQRLTERGHDDVSEGRVIMPSTLKVSMGDSLSVQQKKAFVEENESESEYETATESESSEEVDRKIMRPVFVPKHKRETIKEQEAVQEAELLKESYKEEKMEQRKQQTKQLLADSLQRKEEEFTNAMDGTDNDSDTGLPDDTDDLEDEVEVRLSNHVGICHVNNAFTLQFENWRLREIRRLKRDAEIREQIALEKADLERRRNLTEEERRQEDEAAGKFKPKEKQKWKYLQKYYHKGVFYMDEDSVQKDDVRARDFSEATLEDKFDRASLPAVLQVKKFGMRGRTKYTHLLDQDTTRDKNTLRPDQNIMKSYVEKRAGVHGDLETAGRVTKKSKHN